MLAYLVQGIGFGLTAAAQPGPFQTYVISQSVKNGWRHTLPAALAPLLTDGPIIALAVLVLSQVPPWLRSGLAVASGLFVLYLAWGAVVAWRDFDAQHSVIPDGSEQSVLKAALMNAISPGPYIFWSLVTGPILLAGWRETPLYGVAFLVGFYGAIVGALALIIVLFSTARGLGPKVSRALLGISALALAGFGLYQLWTGVSSWLVPR